MSHAATYDAQSSVNVSRIQLDALLNGSGLQPQIGRGWIRVTGEDRVRWLNGMVTNSVQTLRPGQGCYNFLLSAQGRIQGDAFVFAEPEALLIETDGAFVHGMMTLLDRFIIMDDVELTDISTDRTGLLIAGPKTESLLSSEGISAVPPELAFEDTTWNSKPIRLFHAASPLVPRFEIWSDPSTIESLSSALSESGVVRCGPESLDWLRVLSGTLQYGVDIRDRDLPQETGQTQALHFAKGCYLGQEIVERIRSRGNVHRTSSGFRLEGNLPSPGTSLEFEGKAVGELTSVAAIPLPGSDTPVQLALGYIRREVLERKVSLVYPGGNAHPISTPMLPSTRRGIQPL